MEARGFFALMEFVVGYVEDRFGRVIGWLAGLALILALTLIVIAGITFAVR